MSLGSLEAELADAGFPVVAGCDEAGRGALAGPIVAAAVVLPCGWVPEGLRDSKLLSARQRERLFDVILEGALATNIRRVTPSKLDEIGLQQANITALADAVRGLPLRPDYVLVDGLFRLRLTHPQLRVIKGDNVSAAVAAASILAKVTRDRTMVNLARRYPGYGFDRNKGYGALEHREALQRLGPTPVHRRCFASVASAQLSLLDA